jgi:hypothetical protein
MREKKETEAELTPEELEEQNGEELPDREAMSIIEVPPGHTLPIEPPHIELDEEAST